ncbi:hypothetical protein [Pseudomonas sp. NFX15]|uniref:hypothetical protein n=1 Tax=Pseudomonas sp. NFX15 TaxID=2816958 RepID=UPI003B8D1DF6
MTTAADLIITHADIHTMDPSLPRAQAIAVNQGRIVAVGDNVDIERMAGVETRRLNAQGLMMLPRSLFGTLHPKTRTPVFNLLFTSVIGLIGLNLTVEMATSFINFGAFLGLALPTMASPHASRACAYWPTKYPAFWVQDS